MSKAGKPFKMKGSPYKQNKEQILETLGYQKEYVDFSLPSRLERSLRVTRKRKR
tara:strand:+ start:103 stop:264 length:162 start_codon:yes stop_codon:yes gene_type:complete